MLLNRSITLPMMEDLKHKMVFLGGPRQVGKTTFVTHLLPKAKFQYLNWDIDEQRSLILKKKFSNQPLLVLDEIHKYKKWRNYLKGIFDAIKTGFYPEKQILVTGSARLDLYRFGGDSLQGRYHYWRMLPLSFLEIGGKTKADLENLFHYGGFPEPFSMQSEKESRRWSKEYQIRFIREDLRDLESVQDLGTFELLVNRLPENVGGPLSINSLREDLQVAHKTVSKWLKILEKLYSIFRISPMGGPKIRAVKKEQKHYHFDWTLIPSESLRFENMIAVHLLKYVYWLEDSEGRDVELRYFRDTDSREVDFVVLDKGKPILFVECKWGDQNLSPQLKYLSLKYPKVPAYQVHMQGKEDYQSLEGIRVCSAVELVKNLI